MSAMVRRDDVVRMIRDLRDNPTPEGLEREPLFLYAFAVECLLGFIDDAALTAAVDYGIRRRFEPAPAALEVA